MREIARTPLEVIRAQEEQSEAKDAQLQSLGVSLAQEKAKGVQKDVQISQMGQELAQIKIELMSLKGAIKQ